MRSYIITEVVGSLHRSFELRLFEAGLEEDRKLVFESRDRAYEAAMHYVTEYDGYIPFDDE